MPPTYKRKRGNKEQPRGAILADPENGLPALTPKQESFVHFLLEGKKATEAYRLAYNASDMLPATAVQEASRLKANPRVAAILRAYQREGLGRAAVTLENHLAELERGREIAYDLGQASAGIQAEHYRGKVAGLYEDRITLNMAQDDAMLARQLEAVLGPAGAYVIAEQLGIEQSPPALGKPTEADTIDPIPDTGQD